MATGYSFDGLVKQVNTPLPPADFEMQLTHDVRVQRGIGSPVMVDVSAAGDGSVMRPVPNLYQGNFARASAATYWKNGRLYKAEINEPRFETDVNGRPLGILLEGSSTNVIYQQDCTKLSSGDLRSATAEVAGTFGDFPSYRVTPVEGAKNILRYQGSVVPGQPSGSPDITGWTISAVVKILDPSVTTAVYIGTSPNPQIRQDGSFATAPPDTWKGSVTKLPNGYLLITNSSGIRAQEGNINAHVFFYNITSGTPAAELVYLQVENIHFPTSPIMTDGTAATRASDTLYTDYVFPPEYTLSFDFDLAGYTGRPFGTNLHTAGPNSYMRADGVFYLWNGVLKKYSVGEKIGGHVLGLYSPTATTAYLNTLKVWENLASPDYPANRTLAIGSIGRDQVDLIVGVDPVYGHIKNFRIWNYTLSDLELHNLLHGGQ